MNRLKVIENELVPVYETDIGEKVVYGTELYECLESKQEYSNWVKNRLKECDSIVDEDFTIILSKSTGGRPKQEYIIKLDTAKEMAMLERNEKGKQVRRYFIEVEKRYKARTATAPMPELSPQLQVLIAMELKQKEQDEKLAELEDKASRQEEALKSIQDTLFNTEGDSRRWVIKSIGQIASSPSFDGVRNRYQKTWLESYERLDKKIHCDINKRVEEAKEKAKVAGATKTAIKNISKQSVIADDPWLREKYASVIKEMLIAYCVEVA